MMSSHYFSVHQINFELRLQMTYGICLESIEDRIKLISSMVERNSGGLILRFDISIELSTKANA